MSGLQHLLRQLDLSGEPDLLLADIRRLADLQWYFDLFWVHADMRRLRSDVYKLADLYGADHLRKHPDV